MRRELLAASLIIMNTPQARIQVLNTFPSLQHKNIEVITNGFDSDDFQKQFQNRSDHHFRIVHTGFLHTSIGLHVRHNNWYYKILGKCPPSVNYLTRSHLFLIKAAENLVARYPNFLDDFELILAGHNSEEDISIIRSSVLFKNVKFLGYIPHDKTIELLKSTDLLFLPMQDLPPGIKSTIVPGKTYEYMAASRPILAAVPDGDVCDFLLQSGGNIIVKPSDITSLEKAVESFYFAWRNGHLNIYSQNREFIKRFERRVLTEKLASLLKNLSKKYS
jgi:glycosyltransferase involved in cell wall biosynthesis